MQVVALKNRILTSIAFCSTNATRCASSLISTSLFVSAASPPNTESCAAKLTVSAADLAIRISSLAQGEHVQRGSCRAE